MELVADWNGFILMDQDVQRHISYIRTYCHGKMLEV
ncbi:MAG: hypothetical protein ACI90V_009451 [Bacillariaceae sp.]|jgi:hypothetical protein